MKTSVETLDAVKVKLTVEVEPARVRRAFDEAARHIAGELDLPGFRRGKAPRRLLEQRLGKQTIAQHAMEESLSRYYLEAIESEDIAAVAMPQIDVQEFDESSGARFEATVEVRPRFELPDHTGISVVFPEWDVTDADVDQELERLRERFAELDEVDRAAAQGDYVTLDLRVEIDGQELESAHVEDALYEIGSRGVTPRLDGELIGASAGDALTYTDTLPDDYPDHGGKEARFHVTVRDVRAKTLADLDDDFAATASEFDTLAELRQSITHQLRRRRIVQARREVRGRILEAYVAKVDVPLPPSLIDAERDARIHQLEHQAQQYGVELEEVLGETTREEFEATASDQAATTVKARLVVDALAERLEVGVDDDDLQQELARHALQTGTSPEELARVVQEQGTVAALVSDILRRKAIDAVVAAADVTGEPSREVLVEVGLEAEAEPDAGDGSAVAPSGLILPGQPERRSDAGLVVPGR